MLPGIFYAHLREMARISEKSPGVALAPLCRGSCQSEGLTEGV